MSAALTTHPTPPPALAALLAELRGTRDLSPARAAALLQETPLETDDLLPWTDFQHPIADSYGRRLVAQGEHFELMVMSWVPGDYSAIHDHGSTQWGAVRYFGAADHVTFTLNDGLLEIDERLVQAPGSVRAVDHDLIHLMGNPGRTPFLSLHLYGTDSPNPCITGDARIFDLFENSIQRTDGGVFFALPERDVTRREAGVRADTESRLLHHRLMLARLERMRFAGAAESARQRRVAALRVQTAWLGARAAARG